MGSKNSSTTLRKTVMLGEQTAINAFNKYMHAVVFSKDHKPTMGFEAYTIRLNEIELQIWEPNTDESNPQLMDRLFRGAYAAFLVIQDLNNVSSYNYQLNLIDEFMPPDIPVVIIILRDDASFECREINDCYVMLLDLKREPPVGLELLQVYTKTDLVRNGNINLRQILQAIGIM